jgi:Protein of unknown function (DUF938)
MMSRCSVLLYIYTRCTATCLVASAIFSSHVRTPERTRVLPAHDTTSGHANGLGARRHLMPPARRPLCMFSRHSSSWATLAILSDSIATSPLAPATDHTHSDAHTCATHLPLPLAAESNASFDESLRGRDPNFGIRDFEEFNLKCEARGMALVAREDMPSNNFLCVWQKQ